MKRLTERDERFYSSVNTWKNAYTVSLGNKKAYSTRLKELTTWDKPSESDKDKTREYFVKITALQILISKSN